MKYIFFLLLAAQIFLYTGDSCPLTKLLAASKLSTPQAKDCCSALAYLANNQSTDRKNQHHIPHKVKSVLDKFNINPECQEEL